MVVGALGAGGECRVGFTPPFLKESRGEPRPTFIHEPHLWDGRDFAAHVRHCWINPVKHGLVGHPREWPWSSWHRDGGGAVW